MKIINRYLSVNFYFLPLLIGVILTFGYWDALAELYGRLNAEERYSHGFIIPFVVVYLIYERIELVKKAGLKFSWGGLLFILFACLIYIIGHLSALWTVVQYSLFFMVIGVTLSLVGWKALKEIIVPLCLLALAIPLPYFVDVVLSGKMQLLSSRLGVDFIRFCNIPVFLEGNVIDLGIYKLQVVEACSGLRYMYPLMSIGLICSYMYNEKLWKRIVIFLSTIPVTILMNSFRIGVIGLLVDKYGIGMAEGFLHDFEGWIIFMVCLGILLIEMRLMSKLPLSRLMLLDIEVNKSNVFICDAKNSYSRPLLVSTFLIIFAVALTSFFTEKSEYIPERKMFTFFPSNIGIFVDGKRRFFEGNEQRILKVTDYLLTDYMKGSESVNLYVGYHESQRNGAAPHSPRACIPGSGWSIDKVDRIKLQGNSKSDIFNSNRLVITKGSQKILVYYWFQQRGKVFANEYKMKWDLFVDGLVEQRSDGALVRITTKVGIFDDIDNADRRLAEFAMSLRPVLSEYIPN